MDEQETPQQENPDVSVAKQETTSPPKKPSGGSNRLLGATLIIMFGALLSRVLGLARESLIARTFGQGYDTDIYRAAFLLPDTIFYVIAGGALSSSFIPVFTEYLEKKQEREAWRLFSIVAVMTIAVVGGLILIAELTAAPLLTLCFRFLPVQSQTEAFTPSKISDTVALTRILLPAQICFFLGGLMMGILQVKKNNWGQVFGPVIYNLGIILGCLLLVPMITITEPRWLKVSGLCWGALVGAILGNLLLQWVLVRRVGGKFYFSVFRNFKHPGANKVWKIMWPILFGLSLPHVCPIINVAFAGSLREGLMSALANANQLMQVPLGIFAQAAGIAIFPRLSQLVAQEDTDGFRKTFSFGLRFILFLTLPSAVFLMTLALPIVQFLLQSGKFQDADARITALLLAAYTIGLVGWSAQAIIGRGFYSLKDSRTPLMISTILTILFFVSNMVIQRYSGIQNDDIKALALALATSFAGIMNAAILLVTLHSKLKGLDTRNLVLGSLKIVFASVVMGFAMRIVYDWLTRLPLSPNVTLRSGFLLTVCGLCGVAVYGVLAFALRMEETQTLLEVLKRKRKA